jgi:hypothetical protein
MTINRLNQDVTYLPAFRNLINNGAMQVTQRATSVTGITTLDYYTADRYQQIIESLGTWTQSVENDAPTGSGFRKSLKMLCTTADAAPAASDNLIIAQRLEGQNLQSIRKGTSDAQQLTLSFWVKSNVTGTYIAELRDQDNTRDVHSTYSISSSGTWEKKTIVFSADTTGELDNDNNNSLSLLFWLGAGTNFTSGTLNTSWASITNANRAVGQTNLAAATNNYWQITGVQLEVGAVATPFEFKPYAQELLECQRYYYKVLANSLESFCNGMAVTTSSGRGEVPFLVEMRIKPTAIEQTGTANDYLILRPGPVGESCTSVPTFVSATKNSSTVLFATAANLTSGHAVLFRSNSSNSYLAWSVEL